MKRATFTVTSLILFISILMTLSAGVYASAEAGNTVDTIMTVGTTQAFTEEAVSEEDIQTILQAGLASESAINQQPWYFVAITDQDVMAELSSSSGRPGGGAMPMPQNGSMPEFSKEGDLPPAPQNGTAPEFSKEGEIPAAPQGGAPVPVGNGSAKAALGDSPLAIIVYKNENSFSPNPDFDCGLAVQNMYIAAASLGYGVKIISSPTMTLNGTDHDQICEKLGVDPSLTAVAVLLVGKADNSVDGISGATTRSALSEKTVVIG